MHVYQRVSKEYQMTVSHDIASMELHSMYANVAIQSCKPQPGFSSPQQAAPLRCIERSDVFARKA